MANVSRQGNRIRVFSTREARTASDFARALREAREREYEDLLIDFEDAGSVFPNVAVPLASAIDRVRREGVDIELQNLNEYLQLSHFDRPLLVDPQSLSSQSSVFNIVWGFCDDVQIHLLLQRLLEEVSQRIICRDGVISGLHWALNEVLDNVLVHSQAPVGFVLAQVHAQAHHFAVCVSDQGLGVVNTIRQAYPSLRDHRDALSTAIRAGTTRDKTIGQGNGLWGLTRIVSLNSGQLSITSGRNRLSLEGANDPTFHPVQALDLTTAGTTVDFQLNTEKPIDVAQALEMSTVVNLRMESMENESGGYIVKVADRGIGTGTRKAGEALRILVLNMLEEGKRVVTVDFTGVGMISSSFADEVIGKLVKQLGFVGFTQRVELTGMTELIQQLVHRAVAQRMIEGITNGED